MLRRLESLWVPWAGALVLVLAWLADVAGNGLNPVLRAVIAGSALAVIGLWLLGRCWRTFSGAERNDLLARRWALGLLVLALVVRFAGIQFELTDPPRSDEGVYMVESQKINEGDLFPDTFNYGHFLYYAGALALWVQETLPGPVAGVCSVVYGAKSPFEISRLLLKGINALLGALTALAMFSVGRRLGGLTAGVFSALLIIFSPLYNDISQQLISDVPSGYFAALTMVFVARLVDGENLRDYLLAGVAAGLAAGSKYPGGVVALAIFAVWLYWRWRARDWSWSLLWSALASIGSMLAVMPAFIFARGEALSGKGLDLFFGFRQYAYGGWLGVRVESPALWYGSKIMDSFGLPAVILGLGGIALLLPATRRRLGLVSPFPIGYLLLISAMSMVVRRNLQPALPMVAVILGVGLTGWLQLVSSRRPRWSKIKVAAGIGVVALFLPAVKTVAWDIAHSRPGTRQIAREWIEGNLPDGVSILKEGYTSQLDLERYRVQHLRFAAWLPPEMLYDGTWDYALLARNAHLRFMDPEALNREHQREYAERYREMFNEFELVQEFEPNMLRAGSHMLLYRVIPPDLTYKRRREFPAGDATWVSDETIVLGEGKPLRYTRKWQYAVFTEYLEAGKYLVQLGVDRMPNEGYLYVVTPDNREIGTWETDQSFEIELPERSKYLFRMFLGPPTRLHGWALEWMDEASESPKVMESAAGSG
jgi:4-amino-4-deoxy-L-arabinose transferase-like glycosyltransferase